MAAILLMQQPVRVQHPFNITGHEGAAGHSHWSEDSGFAVLPAIQYKSLPQPCIQSVVPCNKTIRGDVRPGPVVYAGSIAAFQDKFPRWSSSTFM